MKTQSITKKALKLATHRHHETISTPNYFEQIAWQKEKTVIGIDEVGRGCLAGPLVVCAAIVPVHTTYANLKDSKKLSPKARDSAYEWITAHCQYTCVILSPWEVDRHNIYQATRRAMKRAFFQLVSSPKIATANIESVLIDAMRPDIPYIASLPTLTIHSFNKGEQYSKSIAAASIIAKVTRDRLMKQMHNLFSCYSFDAHKGYATAKHRAALEDFRASIMHRRSFLGNFESI